MVRERGSAKSTHPSATGKGRLEEEGGKQVWKGAVALTSGNDINDASLLARAKSGQNSGARNALTRYAGFELLRAKGVVP